MWNAGVGGLRMTSFVFGTPRATGCPCPVTGTNFVVAERDRNGDEAAGLIGLVAHREVQVKTVEARAGVARQADLLTQLDDVAAC